MKRLMVGIFMILSLDIQGAVLVHKPKPTSESEAQKIKKPAAKGKKRAAIKPKKVSVSVVKYYEGRRAKRFTHFLRIYTNPQSNASTKARAAQRMISIEKGIKTPTYKKYIENELKKHRLSTNELQKEAKSASSYLQFTHLINRAALRANQKHGAKTVPPYMAKKLTDLYHKELPEAYQKNAQGLLEKKGLDLTQIEEAAKHVTTTPAKPAASRQPSLK